MVNDPNRRTTTTGSTRVDPAADPVGRTGTTGAYGAPAHNRSNVGKWIAYAIAAILALLVIAWLLGAFSSDPETATTPGATTDTTVVVPPEEETAAPATPATTEGTATTGTATTGTATGGDTVVVPPEGEAEGAATGGATGGAAGGTTGGTTTGQ